MKHIKIVICCLLLTGSMTAQFLSQSKDVVIATLKDKIPYETGINVDGFDFILVPNISSCKCIYIFDKQQICHTEIITALTDVSIVDMMMDLDQQHYIKLNEVYWHEETYGLVEVNKSKNTFTFHYE